MLILTLIFFFFFQEAFKSLCQSTHLYGRRLVLEWAQAEENVEEIRKRTAQKFLQGNQISCIYCALTSDSELIRID